MVHPTLTVMLITFFFVAYVKCGLYEININISTNAEYRPGAVQKMFRVRSKATADQSGPGPGPVLTLITYV